MVLSIDSYNMVSIALAATLTPQGTLRSGLANNARSTSTSAYFLIDRTSFSSAHRKFEFCVVTSTPASRSREADREPKFEEPIRVKKGGEGCEYRKENSSMCGSTVSVVDVDVGAGGESGLNTDGASQMPAT